MVSKSNLVLYQQGENDKSRKSERRDRLIEREEKSEKKKGWRRTNRAGTNELR
jgi:hypothetical protein